MKTFRTGINVIYLVSLFLEYHANPLTFFDRLNKENNGTRYIGVFKMLQVNL